MSGLELHAQSEQVNVCFGCVCVNVPWYPRYRKNLSRELECESNNSPYILYTYHTSIVSATTSAGAVSKASETGELRHELMLDESDRYDELSTSNDVNHRLYLPFLSMVRTLCLAFE